MLHLAGLRPLRNLILKHPAIRIVHGFAVTSIAFRPLISRLHDRGLDAELFRYPSIGLSLNEIVDRLSANLREHTANGIVSHSLGCFATLMAARQIGWTGPMALLAPPMRTLPATRLIPTRMRQPLAPLLDHRSLTSAAGYRPSVPPGCRVRAIAGRFDFTVPLNCTHCEEFADHRVLSTTHNGLLLSRKAVDLCFDWFQGFEADDGS